MKSIEKSVLYANAVSFKFVLEFIVIRVIFLRPNYSVNFSERKLRVYACSSTMTTSGKKLRCPGLGIPRLKRNVFLCGGSYKTKEMELGNLVASLPERECD